VKEKIVVTGANGQLGQELKKISNSFIKFDFIFLSREELAIQDSEAVNTFFDNHKPKYLINCAAYTAVDKAESEKELAFQINGEAAGILAAACEKNHTSFIHVSTDYVFDGASMVPYKEDFQTNPQSVYGASKLKGEELVLQNNPSSIIIRTAWVYSEFGKNFVKTMMKLMTDRDGISVVSDQVGSPTYAADLAAAIMKIINEKKWVAGIYNYSNEGIISWFDFAVAIKEITGLNCKINPIPTTQYPTPAKRPAYSLLDKTKIKETFNIIPPNWKKSLAVCVSHLQST